MVEHYGPLEGGWLVDYVKTLEENRKKVLRPNFQLFLELNYLYLLIARFPQLYSSDFSSGKSLPKTDHFLTINNLPDSSSSIILPVVLDLSSHSSRATSEGFDTVMWLLFTYLVK